MSGPGDSWLAEPIFGNDAQGGGQAVLELGAVQASRINRVAMMIAGARGVGANVDVAGSGRFPRNRRSSCVRREGFGARSHGPNNSRRRNWHRPRGASGEVTAILDVEIVFLDFEVVPMGGIGPGMVRTGISQSTLAPAVQQNVGSGRGRLDAKLMPIPGCGTVANPAWLRIVKNGRVAAPTGDLRDGVRAAALPRR